MTEPCMAPFRGQPMQDLSYVTVGLSSAQCRRGWRAGWVASPALPGLATLHRAVTTRRALAWAGRPGPDVFHEPSSENLRSLETALPRLRSVATRKRSTGTWPSEPSPHRERPLSAGRSENPPSCVFRACAMPAFDACRNRARAPRVPARPPSADRSGTAERELGCTLLALSSPSPDFRGPVRDARRAVNLYGSWKLR